MSGRTGYVAIGLRDYVYPSAVSIQHISMKIAPDRSTTPKDFIVWGVHEDNFPRSTTLLPLEMPPNGAQPRGLRVTPYQPPFGTFLGRFTYDWDSSQVQTFQLQNLPARPHPDRDAFSIIVISFVENYGNKEYTCIYRVRVHGKSANLDKRQAQPAGFHLETENA
jgi:hypothetical protein